MPSGAVGDAAPFGCSCALRTHWVQFVHNLYGLLNFLLRQMRGRPTLRGVGACLPGEGQRGRNKWEALPFRAVLRAATQLRTRLLLLPSKLAS